MRAHPPQSGREASGPSHSSQRPHSGGASSQTVLPSPGGLTGPLRVGDAGFTLRPHSENLIILRERKKGGRERETSICHSLMRSLADSPVSLTCQGSAAPPPLWLVQLRSPAVCHHTSVCNHTSGLSREDGRHGGSRPCLPVSVGPARGLPGGGRALVEGLLEMGTGEGQQVCAPCACQALPADRTHIPAGAPSAAAACPGHRVAAGRRAGSSPWAALPTAKSRWV